MSPNNHFADEAGQRGCAARFLDMPKSSSKELSIVEAARLIYHTRSPSDEQIQRVYKRMKSGSLPVRDYGRAPLEWTTTEQALADYLASQMLKPRAALPPPEPIPRRAPATRSTRLDREATQLRSVYRGMWRDYFLAVMLRRRMGHRSLAFRRAVLAGQIVFLASFLGLLMAAIRITTEPTLPERVAIERWIDECTDRHQVVRWHPTQIATDGRVMTVEVEYRYAKDSPRTITTRRTFRVVDSSVEEISTE